MGIYIFGEIAPTKINKEAWEKTYEDTLKLVKYGQLAECEYKYINGYKIPCVVPAVEKDGCWSATGDMVAGKCIEKYSLYRDISHYTAKDININNPALELLYNRKTVGKTNIDDMFKMYFGSKTQGNNPHMILLSIACVISNDFPEAAIVHGDITHAQCVKACELAEKVLGRHIDLPIQYDHERLYSLLINEGYTEYKLFERFYTIYNGWTDNKYIGFIHNKFPEEYFIRYYTDKIKSWPLDIVVKEWLERQLSLEGLFEVYKSNYTGNKSLQDFINKLILGQIHIRDKTIYSFSEKSEYDDIPDDIDMMLARFMAKVSGYSRYIINAYIPHKELMAKFIYAFPSYSVRDMFDKALSNCSNSKIEELYKQVFDLSDKIASKQYDIQDLRFMYLWDDNKTVEPTLWNRMLEFVRTAEKLGRDAISGSLKKSDNRLAYICKYLGKYYALPEELAEKILTKFADDEYIAKYIGIFGMPFDDLDSHRMCHILMMNEKLLDRLIKDVRV
ncbi:hypothetical protein [Ruminococcus sp. NK3A76]|uniref:hypothetical protein n=1 Tax=Ruminococcus sp. NK3A76 TaxID=877411 RepID=UPI00048BC078|nr:hypothetical protein [Ruminococcus sp. NK3A76]